MYYECESFNWVNFAKAADKVKKSKDLTIYLTQRSVICGFPTGFECVIYKEGNEVRFIFR